MSVAGYGHRPLLRSVHHRYFIAARCCSPSRGLACLEADEPAEPVAGSHNLPVKKVKPVPPASRIKKAIAKDGLFTLI